MATRPVIACDDELLRLRPLLEEAGYDVRPLSGADLEGVDAVVLSGLDEGLAGDQRRLTPAPVVVARGMTPRQLVEALEQRLRRR